MHQTRHQVTSHLSHLVSTLLLFQPPSSPTSSSDLSPATRPAMVPPLPPTKSPLTPTVPPTRPQWRPTRPPSPPTRSPLTSTVPLLPPLFLTLSPCRPTVPLLASKQQLRRDFVQPSGTICSVFLLSPEQRQFECHIVPDVPAQSWLSVYCQH